MYSSTMISTVLSIAFLIFSVGTTDAIDVCEGGNLSIQCPAGYTILILGANYGRTDSTTCPHRQMSNTNCHAAKAREIVDAACNDKVSCVVPATNQVFGDPCYGTYKYLSVTFGCVRGLKLVTACENSIAQLTCLAGRIHVLDANYGRRSSTLCPHPQMSDTNCTAVNSNAITSNGCNGKTLCRVPATNSVFGDPCYGTYKYLSVAYHCDP